VAGVGVARRRPAQELPSDDEPGCAVAKHERSIGELVEHARCRKLLACARRDALEVELLVDRIGAGPTGMELVPDVPEANIVLSATEGTRSVAGRERRGLVEEEELCEATWLEKRSPPPAAEFEPAGDPALAVVASANAAGLVVEAAAAQ
jgi:hypothetical protein